VLVDLGVASDHAVYFTEQTPCFRVVGGHGTVGVPQIAEKRAERLANAMHAISSSYVVENVQTF
jgi:alkylated DNA nucleotide flippase Atl1